MPEKIAGLPTHPLIIHLPVVLGPVVGLLCILLLVPALRSRLLVPTAILGVVLAVSAVLAVDSGEALARTIGIGGAVAAHAEAARTLRLLAIVLATGLVLLALGARRLPTWAATIAVIVVAVAGGATAAFTVITGHRGAELVWKGAGDQGSGDGD